MSAVQDLIQAVKAGHAPRVAELLEEAPDLVQARAESGDTPLLTAIYYGAKDVIAVLLANGVRPDVFESAALGDLPRLRAVVEDQAELVRACSHDGWSPLHLAAHFGHPEAVAWLLERGASVQACSQNALANTPLHAAVAGRRRSAVEALLAARADVDGRDSMDNTALHIAAQNGSLEIVQILLDHGAQVNARTEDGRTPRSIAAQAGHVKIMDLLFRSGAEA